jgi:hypothetical protein
VRKTDVTWLISAILFAKAYFNRYFIKQKVDIVKKKPLSDTNMRSERYLNGCEN